MAYPILYAAITPGTVPNNYGLGTLSDTISCTVEEKRNDSFELSLIYPANGIHAEELEILRVIKAKPNPTDDVQLFRIYDIEKSMDGQTLTVSAAHISYDLSGLTITAGEAINPASACALLEASAPGYTFATTKTGAGNFKITEPSSVRSWLAGKAGSLLDVYGTGEYKFNNFRVDLKTHRGEQTPRVTIRYAKNLLQLSQKISAANLATSVQAFYKDSEGNITLGTKIQTGLSLDAPREMVIDASQDFESTPTAAQLDTYATNYINGHTLTVPSDNITLDFAQIGELKDRVDLCDKVNIYYEAFGITATAKCIRTKFDVLQEKYIETEFGDARTELAETLAGSAAATEAATSAASAANAAATAAASKKRVFITEPVPPYDVGDLWIDGDTLLYCDTAKASGEEFDDGDWVTSIQNTDADSIETAINTATALITGNAGGHVVIHDSNADGQPDEILIMDTADINTARKVWRWNSAGLAFSSTGYGGPYAAAAITSDGQINADAITTGSIDASNVTIQNLTARMFTGSKITLGGLDNQAGTFELLDGAGVKIGEMTKDGLKFYDQSGAYVVLNYTDGFKGYDANNNPLFWVSQEEFHMEKCVVETEITACGKLRALPIVILNGGGEVENDGVAIVGIVDE